MTPQSNPVVADTSGMFAPVYLTSPTFKAVLATSADVTVQTIDPCFGGTTGAVSALNATSLSNTTSILYGLLRDLGGVNTVGGTATAVTVTTTQAFTAYGTGDGKIDNGTILTLKMSAAATGAATLNVNVIGTKKLRRQGDSAIQANDWLANALTLWRYDTAYDSAAGAWVLLNADASSAFLPLAGGTMTGQVNFAPTVTVASATTTNIGAAAANQLIISGTTTITAFDTVAAGITREVLFSGALTLTHDGTKLILPGSANITTAANDTAAFRSLGSGNWVCLWYKKASGGQVADQGAAPAYSCRAWVNFNGTGTVAIRASGNVSSITDNGTGDYTVNYTTSMADANYAIVITGQRVSAGSSGLVCGPTAGASYAPAAASCRFVTANDGGTAEDPTAAFVAVFR